MRGAASSARGRGTSIAGAARWRLCCVVTCPWHCVGCDPHRVCIYGFIYGRRSSCLLALHCGWLNDGRRCGWVARGPRCSERWSDVVKYSVDASRDAVYAFVQSPARDGGNLCVCTPNDLHHASKLDHVPSLHRAKLQRHIIGRRPGAAAGRRTHPRATHPSPPAGQPWLCDKQCPPGLNASTTVSTGS